ncbi:MULTISPECIES: hypothetical protein [Nitrincola]|uniref:Uncharacterized protein n=1 Tax=Nitrincola nitratireducens TaxID=1229521 RepID=W9V5N9_9GAMM|nr:MULTISPECIES: hypothetical protein [Nitrincola]EXJ11417.1 hypothetical protein D791_01549 [Nitrincola nitratireducens]
MLTYSECLAMSDLTDDEIDAIAEHEHIEPMIAVALGQYLVERHEETEIRRFIMDDIEIAKQCGDLGKMVVRQHTLVQFIQTHPEACRSSQ